MDVEDIQRVISYDAPAHVETYLHRAGRTARAGRCGMAYCLLRKQLNKKPFVALSRKPKIKVEPLVLDAGELRVLKPEVDAILKGIKDKWKQTVSA